MCVVVVVGDCDRRRRSLRTEWWVESIAEYACYLLWRAVDVFRGIFKKVFWR
jgi:hypothetical protein